MQRLLLLLDFSYLSILVTDIFTENKMSSFSKRDGTENRKGVHIRNNAVMANQFFHKYNW